MGFIKEEYIDGVMDYLLGLYGNVEIIGYELLENGQINLNLGLEFVMPIGWTNTLWCVLPSWFGIDILL